MELYTLPDDGYETVENISAGRVQGGTRQVQPCVQGKSKPRTSNTQKWKWVLSIAALIHFAITAGCLVMLILLGIRVSQLEVDVGQIRGNPLLQEFSKLSGSSTYDQSLLKGQKGEPGAMGVKGARGDIGLFGCPGHNASIGLDGIKCEKRSTGSRGPPGIQGLQGPKVQRGYGGATGQKGPRGYTGVTGEKGAKGQIGNTGPQGYRGFTGHTGQKGTKGAQGPRGSSGSGPPGPPGPPGTAARPSFRPD